MSRQALRTTTMFTQPARQTLASTINRPLFTSYIRLQSTDTHRSTGTPPFATGATAPARVSDRIKHDHRELQDYYHNIKTAQRDDDKVRWQNQFVWELARHSIAEEMVVYPAFEKHIPDGVKMADKDRAEHQLVKQMLYDFESLKPSDQTFDETIDTLWQTLAQHIKEEERDDLPALERALDATASGTLARSFDRTKHFVPTRSHPSAPDKPPYETAAGLLAAPMDKLMDMFRKFPKGG